MNGSPPVTSPAAYTAGLRRAQALVGDHVRRSGATSTPAASSPSPAVRGERPVATRIAIEGDLAAVGQTRCTGSTVRGRDGIERHSGAHVDAVRHEPRLDQRTGPWLLSREQSRQALELDDPGAQPGERLAELAADRAATDHQQAAREAARAPTRSRRSAARRRRGPGRAAASARCRWRGSPAGIAAPARPLAACARRRSWLARGSPRPRRPGDARGSRAARWRPARRARAPSPPRGRSRARPPSSPTRCGVTHPVGQVGRRDQGLARHASGPQAVATGAIALDKRHARAEPGRDVRGHEAAGAAADDDQVVVLHDGGTTSPWVRFTTAVNRSALRRGRRVDGRPR